MTASSPPAQWVDREFVFTHEFAAPRERVWQAWSDPAHLARWWGPHGFTNPACEVDLHPGGALRIVIHGPDGTDYRMAGVFREIVPPERLAFTSMVDDGEQVHFEVLMTVTFAAQGSRTRLTVQARVIRATDAAAKYLAGMEQGWAQRLQRLAEFVAAFAGAH